MKRSSQHVGCDGRRIDAPRKACGLFCSNARCKVGWEARKAVHNRVEGPVCGQEGNNYDRPPSTFKNVESESRTSCVGRHHGELRLGLHKPIVMRTLAVWVPAEAVHTKTLLRPRCFPIAVCTGSIMPHRPPRGTHKS